MARTGSRSGDPIDRLLQERQQYTVWLARLDTTSDTVPESVRTRVHADYQARLDAVIEQLRSHGAGLVEQLDRHRDSRAELLTREAQAKEIMSEAEVRHAVGEYGDAKWQQIRGEAQRNLVTIREELAEINEEISELEKVQSMIATPAVVPEPPAPPPPPPPPPVPPVAAAPPLPVAPAMADPRPSDEFPELSAAINEMSGASAPAATPPPAPPPAEPPAVAAQAADSAPKAPEPPKPAGPGQTTIRPAPGTVRPVKPKDGAGQTPGRTLWFPSVKEDEVNAGVDELAFLKSVSEDEKTGPSARRASGGVPRPPETLGPPNVASPSQPLTTAAHTLEPTGGPTAADMQGRPSVPTAQRTLKCGECGTMNRPTEWYCERCGAELADL